MKELFDLSWKILGWFVAGLMFIFSVCLILFAICLCIEVTIELGKEIKKNWKNEE